MQVSRSLLHAPQLARTVYCLARRDTRAATTFPPAAARHLVVAQLAATASMSSAAGSKEGGGRPSWDIRMLYDGDCPLCMKEVEFLRRRDQGKDKIDFVDIASPSYTAQDNAGIDYETAMRKIHAITADGGVITGVEVFRRLYEAVGLGWVYAVTRYEPVGKLAEMLYNVWAKYRMEVTGREALALVLAKRKMTDETTTCGVGAGACKEGKEGA